MLMLDALVATAGVTDETGWETQVLNPRILPTELHRKCACRCHLRHGRTVPMLRREKIVDVLAKLKPGPNRPKGSAPEASREAFG